MMRQSISMVREPMLAGFQRSAAGSCALLVVLVASCTPPGTCRSDADCPRGKHCLGGTCEPKPSPPPSSSSSGPSNSSSAGTDGGMTHLDGGGCQSFWQPGCTGVHVGRISPLLSLQREMDDEVHTPRLITRTQGDMLYVILPKDYNAHLVRFPRDGVMQRFGEPEDQYLDPNGAYMNGVGITADELQAVVNVTVMDGGPYRLQLLTRTQVTEPFTAVGDIFPDDENNTARQDPFLYKRGERLELWFSHYPGDRKWIYRSVQSADGGMLAFGAPQPISVDTVLATHGISDPVLSPDGLTLFFLHHRLGGEIVLKSAKRSSLDSLSFRDTAELGFSLLDPYDALDLELGAVFLETKEVFIVAHMENAIQRSIFRARLHCSAECASTEPVVDCAERGAQRTGDKRTCFFPGAVDGGVPWVTAERACGTSWNQHLAIIDTRAENAVVSAALGATEAWLGLAEVSSDDWVWSQSGETILFEQWDRDAGYPVDTAGTGCVYMSGGNWRNAPCTNSMPYVCEREMWPW